MKYFNYIIIVHHHHDLFTIHFIYTIWPKHEHFIMMHRVHTKLRNLSINANNLFSMKWKYRKPLLKPNTIGINKKKTITKIMTCHSGGCDYVALWLLFLFIFLFFILLRRRSSAFLFFCLFFILLGQHNILNIITVAVMKMYWIDWQSRINQRK